MTKIHQQKITRKEKLTFRMKTNQGSRKEHFAVKKKVFKNKTFNISYEKKISKEIYKL